MRALLALLLLAGCTQRTDLLPIPDGGAGCSAPIQLGGECTGALAARRLRYALCSCSSLVLDHGLFTEGGSGLQGPPPAAVGTDGSLQIDGLVQVAGALNVAGSFGTALGRSASVLGNLRSGGSLAASSFVSIAGDAFVDGDVLGRMDINGTLHFSPGAFVSSSVYASGFVEEPVMVAPPCDCNQLSVDVASEIANRYKINDNARINLAADTLTGANPPRQLELPCGEFHLDEIRMPSEVELELRVHGRSALFVSGDVTLGRGLRVILDPGAELDLVVAGDFTVLSGVVGATSPELVRIWLGFASLQLYRFSGISAAVHAPETVVLAEDNLLVDGALLAAGLGVPGDVSIHFAAEILNGGSCGTPPEPAVE